MYEAFHKDNPQDFNRSGCMGKYAFWWTNY